MNLRPFTLLGLVAALVHPSTCFAQGTAFNYQGQLTDNTSPAHGAYDLQFTIYDAPTGGNIAGGPLTNAPVALSNGLFTVTLDFGAGVFTGADRWLEIGVRTNGGGAFTNLSPRQHIASTPYAVRALNAGSAASYTGAISDSQLSANMARLNGSNVFSGVVQFNNATNHFAGSFTGDGSGVTNVMFTALNAPGILSWRGNFALASSPLMGGQPSSVVALDVNGDGRLDLASADASGNSLSVRTNSGNGVDFGTVSISVPANPRSVATADVNGDGKPDLICASAGGPGVLVVLTNFGGGFVRVSTNTVDGSPQMVVTADVNADGKPDLISANGNTPGTLTVLTNNGSGGFVFASTNSVGNNPVAVTAADIDRDGDLDLISANNISSGTLSVMTNNGSGGFGSAFTLSVGNNPRSVVAVDTDADGYPELISANSGSATVEVVQNVFGVAFNDTGPPFPAGNSPVWVTAADFNENGRPDLICANNITPGTLTVLRDIRFGEFSSVSTVRLGNQDNLPVAVIAADVNGDSKLDLVSANGSGKLSVLFNVPTFTGSGAGLFDIPANAITGGLTTNIAVLVPGGFTNRLFFTNGILRTVQ